MNGFTNKEKDFIISFCGFVLFANIIINSKTPEKLEEFNDYEIVKFNDYEIIINEVKEILENNENLDLD
jgi:hypothetical protein